MVFQYLVQTDVHMQMGNYMEITAAVYTTLEKVQLAAIIAYSTLI